MSEWRQRASAELQRSELGEEEASQLKETNEKLQRQMKTRAITAGYFTPRLSKIMQVVEELRDRMPLEDSDLF